MTYEEKFELAKDTTLSLLKNFEMNSTEYDDMMFLWEYICFLKSHLDIYKERK